MFGKFIKEIRVRQRLGLREFCLEHDYDPSNWSKVERELLPPPKDQETLRRWAKSLNIAADSKNWKTFFDYAALDVGMIPKYILDDKELVAKLPVFFRTIEGKKPSRADLEKLATILRNT